MDDQKPIVGLGTTLTKGQVVKITSDMVWLDTGRVIIPCSFASIVKMIPPSWLGLVRSVS